MRWRRQLALHDRDVPADQRLGGDRRIGGLRGEFTDQAVGIGCDIVGRLDHQSLQRPAIGRNALLQALLDPLHDHCVLFHAGDRIGRSRGDSSDTIFRLALRLRSSSMMRAAEAKNGSNRADVVADVLDQLLIARGVRAVRLVDQRASVSGAVEHHLLPPWRRQRLVIAEHALPGRPRMRRLDQGIGEIAKLALVFGELKVRGLEADAAGGFGAQPAVIRRCACPHRCGRNRRRYSRRAPRRSKAASSAGRERPKPGGPDREIRLRHCKGPWFRGAVDDGDRALYLLPARARRRSSRLTLNADNRKDQQMIYCLPSLGAPPMAAPGRRKCGQGPDAPGKSSKEVWGRPAYTGHTHYVRVHMAELRKKIEQDPARRNGS